MSSVDWALAGATARRLIRPGPAVTHGQAAAAVADLRTAAVRASESVAAITGLQPASEPAPILVVDRPNWVAANLAGFAELLSPLTGEGFSAVSARVSGLEAGALLAYLSTKVLGQYDPYREPTGQLLLVAPNIVHAERELRVDPHDFRLWVALHEQTHMLQFTHGPDGGAPWLRDHLRGRISVLLTETGLGTDMLVPAVRAIAGRLRGGDGEVSLMDLVATDEQRALVAEITAVMSLLEGHADLVMDEVGPEVVPTVAAIRARFEARRDRRGWDGLVRAALGMDAKLRQYRDGVRFCREVLGAVGMAGLNRVFTSPDTLPQWDEIAAPDRWLERVRPRA